MSAHGFIITRGGIIVVDTAVSSAAAASVLSQVGRQIADDAARLAEAWQNSKSLNEFVGNTINGDSLGVVKVVGAVAFGTAAAIAVPPLLLGAGAVTAGSLAIGGIAGWVAGEIYGKAFDGAVDFSKNLNINEMRPLPGSIEPKDIQFPGPLDQPDFSDPEVQRLIEALADAFNNAQNQASPIILDLDGNGVQTVGLDAGVHFDHNANGFAQQTGWVGQGDGLLAANQAHWRQAA